MTGTGVRRFYVETLGCPKNAVDSDKVAASLVADGLEPAAAPDDADLLVVNTCAFIEAARQESIDTILSLAARRNPGAKLVVTGCLAERAGDELAAALPEVDAVVGFAGEGALAHAVPVGMPRPKPAGVRDLLELPRAAPSVPWAYVKVAEGCDRACAFCAIPSFRGKQRSRTPESIEAEVRALVEGGVAEVVLVAQDLAWYGRDAGEPGSLSPLLHRLDALAAEGLARLRLLYLYPSEVREPLVSTMLELPTVVPYFDLSLQHADATLLRAMKRWGAASGSPR
ncbi:MAG TPA: radical SAM protein [Acidimicrobiia bacterium]